MSLFHKISASDKRLFFMSLPDRESCLSQVRKIAKKRAKQGNDFLGHIVFVDRESKDIPSYDYYRNGILVLYDVDASFLYELFQVDNGKCESRDYCGFCGIEDIRTALSKKDCIIVVVSDKATLRILRDSFFIEQYNITIQEEPHLCIISKITRGHKGVYHNSNNQNI